MAIPSDITPETEPDWFLPDGTYIGPGAGTGPIGSGPGNDDLPGVVAGGTSTTDIAGSNTDITVVDTLPTDEQNEIAEAAEAAEDASLFVTQVMAMFPWLGTIGLDPAFIHEIAATSSGTDEIMIRLRQSEPFKRRFPGMYRDDGTVRMNEAQYLAREADYRSVLRQYGYDMSLYEDPSQMVGFFSNEMAPDELGQRLDTYRNIQESSQAQRDAFYVYAGMSVSVDDLYEAVVDPGAAQNLRDEYNQNVAAGNFDYQTWITRATEVGLSRVADLLSSMEARGEVTSSAVQAVLRVNPEFAQSIMDAIYTGGDGNTTATMSLEDLLSSFEFAAVGAAATQSGLLMPTRERLAEIRQAGATRQQQIEGYRSYGQQKNRYNAASLRSGGGGFTQSEFESAAFFGDVRATQELETALAQEEAAGDDVGEFRFAEDRGRLVQRGLGR